MRIRVTQVPKYFSLRSFARCCHALSAASRMASRQSFSLYRIAQATLNSVSVICSNRTVKVALSMVNPPS